MTSAITNLRIVASAHFDHLASTLAWLQVKQALWNGGIQRANAPEGQRSTPGSCEAEKSVGRRSSAGQA